jgi:hypothetical protein
MFVTRQGKCFLIRTIDEGKVPVSSSAERGFLGRLAIDEELEDVFGSS